jgi:two-component system sensor histidine kinase UhpB
MSLRNRLLLAIAAGLFASFLAGIGLTAWQARVLVRAELVAALETGAQGAAATLQDIAGRPDPPALSRLVASFDGSRHVQAALWQGGLVIAQSHPSVPAKSPGWFVRLASPTLAAVELRANDRTMLRLSPLPASEVGERWGEAHRLIVLLALSSLLTAGLCIATVAISLRPLGLLAGAFGRLERGRGGTALPQTGPSELRTVAAAFNRMQEALRAADHENRRLSAQLARLAEEERVELARDLHDEVGPLLFAITAWAAAARLQDAGGDAAAATASLHALENAAAELQQAVRALLKRLRDSAPVATDLAASLEELLAFWRGIRPQTEFRLQIEDGSDAVREPASAALFRVAQEGVSNAVRHSNPSRVSVAVATRDNGLTLVVEDDGTGGAPGDGFGLVGMEERLHALGGRLAIDRERGWRVTAWTPADPPAAA